MFYQAGNLNRPGGWSGEHWGEDEDEEQSHTPERAGRREGQGRKVEVRVSLVNPEIDSAVPGGPCPKARLAWEGKSMLPGNFL